MDDTLALHAAILSYFIPTLSFLASIAGCLFLAWTVFKLALRRTNKRYYPAKSLLRAALWSGLIIICLSLLSRFVLVQSFIAFLSSSLLYLLCLSFWVFREYRRLKRVD